MEISWPRRNLFLLLWDRRGRKTGFFIPGPSLSSLFFPYARFAARRTDRRSQVRGKRKRGWIKRARKEKRSSFFGLGCLILPRVREYVWLSFNLMGKRRVTVTWICGCSHTVWIKSLSSKTLNKSWHQSNLFWRFNSIFPMCAFKTTCKHTLCVQYKRSKK